MATISFSGLASGIDGDAVIKALTDARRVASLPLENKLDAGKAESAAYDEFKAKLLTLSDGIQKFRTLSGSAIGKKAASSNENALKVSAGSNALSASTTVDVLALAKAGSMSFDDVFSATDTKIASGLSTPSSISVTVGVGASAKSYQFAVDSTTTLASLAAKINDTASADMRAAVINVGSESAPQYKLVLNAVNTGVEKGTLAVSVPPEISALGIFGSQTTEAASDARVSVQGIGEVRRATNQISDLIPGVTLDLRQAGMGPAVISVSNDTEATAKSLTDVVAMLNEIIGYSNDNDKIDRVETEKGVSNVFGSLARSSVDDQAIDALKRALANANSGTDGSSIRILADLGITTQRDGKLAFDTAKFEEAMGKDPSAADRLLNNFADALGGVDGAIANYTRFKGLIDIAKQSNDREAETINDKLTRLERSIERQTQSLKMVFSRLESEVARLNSSSNALAGLISSAGQSK